jgi:hypothetical protein
MHRRWDVRDGGGSACTALRHPAMVPSAGPSASSWRRSRVRVRVSRRDTCIWETGVCGEEFRTLPGTQRRVSASAPAARAHAIRLLDHREPLSGPAADPRIREFLFCWCVSCPVGGGAGAFPRMNMHQPSISPVGRAHARRRPRSGDATRGTPISAWLKHAGLRGRPALPRHMSVIAEPGGVPPSSQFNPRDDARHG